MRAVAAGPVAPSTPDDVAGRRRRAARRRAGAVRVAAIVLIAVVWLAPVVWIAATAFKAPRDVLSVSLWFEPTLENFVAAFGAPYFVGQRLLNSLIVTVGTLVLSIPIATAAAYAFSRFRFPGGAAWPLGLLATQFVPGVMVIIPLFVVFRGAGLLDTPVALIVTNMSLVVPYAVWMIKGFIDAIPRDMEEAAQIDGAGRLRVLWDVVVPVAMPGIVTAAIFAFVVSWNEFFYALILTRDQAVTLPVSLMSARTDRGDAWEIMAVIGLAIMVPLMLVSGLIQKHFTQGLTSGAVK